MAKEVLAIPEEHLKEVIQVIRVGLQHVRVAPEVLDQLTIWCMESEEYLKGLED